MRAFVAVEVPEVVGSLVKFQEEISATGADLKLVERENLHFTILFLGEIAESQAAEARSRLARLSLEGGIVEVKGAGAFPSPGRPKVVWAGVSAEHERLVASVAEGVRGALAGIGEKDDRPFRAHITLGRARSSRNSNELAGLLRENEGRSFGTAKLSGFRLKSSVLTPGGPVYTVIGAFPLR